MPIVSNHLLIVFLQVKLNLLSSVQSSIMIKIGNLEIPDRPLILAPMEDISDPPFRVICMEMGADLVYSEFISSEGLIRDADKSKIKLDIFPGERPIAIQVFGHDEKSMTEAVNIIEKVKPDMIDINYGCPVKKVVKKGAGAAALQNLPQMVKMTEKIVKSTKIPVTVKTRLAWDSHSIKIVELCEMLQDVGVAAIAVHARTAVQQYSGTADWAWFKRIKNNNRFKIPLFGNGDINTPQKAKTLFDEYQVDGVMIGRASIGNPWIFKLTKHYLKGNDIPFKIKISEKAEVCRRHLMQSVKWKGERLGILEMRPHYAHYFKGIYHFKAIRIKLVESTDLNQITGILDSLANSDETQIL